MAGSSFQEAAQSPEKARLVGRANELDIFQANLVRSANDPERRSVFYIYGDGGVGKTFLIEHFRRIALERDLATARFDAAWWKDSGHEIPKVIDLIASSIKRHRKDMGGSNKTVGKYYRHRLDVITDSQTPPGTAAFLTEAGANVGLSALRGIPGVGGFANLITPAEVEQLGKFVAKAARHSDDAQMLLFPVDTITSIFVRDLAEVARRRTIVLFFDSCEKTGLLLDGWIQSMLDGRYGDLPKNMIIVMAGRNEPDLSNWAPHGDKLITMKLISFSEREARELLIIKDVTDEQVVKAILEASGRLPLLVEHLGQGKPADPGQVGDLSGAAVDMFLKGEPKNMYGLALTAAIPRVVNEDVLAVLIPLLGSAQTVVDQDRWTWLQSQHFVTNDAGRCIYHEPARSAMIKQARGKSEVRWRRCHQALAEAFQAWRLGRSGGVEWDESWWRNYKLEETYHLLCANPAEALPRAVREWADIYTHHATAAGQWIQMFIQAGRDSSSEKIRTPSQRLEEIFHAGDHKAMLAYINVLLAKCESQ